MATLVLYIRIPQLLLCLAVVFNWRLDREYGDPARPINGDGGARRVPSHRYVWDDGQVHISVSRSQRHDRLRVVVADGMIR